MTAKQFELEILYNNKYVIAEFDKDNYYLDDEISVKSLECRLNELFNENERLKKENTKLHQKILEMRPNVTLERTEISYTLKEFLDEIEK